MLPFHLLAWSAAPATKFLTIMAGAGLISLAACLLLDSNRVTRVLVGLRPDKPLAARLRVADALR